MGIELEMVTKLGSCGILDPRLECGEHPAAIELLRCARIIMTERHVSRLPWSYRERQAHDLRTHVVQAVGLGIEGHERRRGEPGKPGIKGLLRQDLVIVARLRQGE